MNKEIDIKIFAYKILFVALLVILIGTVAKLFVFFNSGADELSVFSNSVKHQTVHQPGVEWDLRTNEISAELDEFSKIEITDAYKNAWYFLNQSVEQKSDLALKDHFTDSLRIKIINQFKSQSYQITQVDLHHNIQLHLFSYDRQLIAFRDNRVPIYSRVLNSNGDLMSAKVDTHNYEVVMILEDGRWKINDLQLSHFTKTDKQNHTMQKKQVTNWGNIVGVNYYPQNSPWLKYWEAFHLDTVIRDLTLVKELGFNAFRTFIPYSEVGRARLNNGFIKDLRSLLEVADQQGLTCMLALFDFPESYEPKYYPAQINHLTQIIKAVEDYDNVIIDLKNEPDLDIPVYNQLDVLSWLEIMINHIKSINNTLPITIGWSKIDYAHLFVDELDFISFHLYGNINNFELKLNTLRERTSDAPILCSEFGVSSYSPRFLPMGNEEDDQAKYLASTKAMFEKNRIGYMVWNLYDYPDLDRKIFGWKPWIINSQKEMGLIDQTGRKKKAASVF